MEGESAIKSRGEGSSASSLHGDAGRKEMMPLQAPVVCVVVCVWVFVLCIGRVVVVSLRQETNSGRPVYTFPMYCGMNESMTHISILA